MTSALNARTQNQLFSAFALQEILDKPLEGETPQSRLKLLGLMTVLYMMHQSNEALTLANISRVTGLARNPLADSVDALVARGILLETMGKNSMGRGMAKQYQFSPAVLERLKSRARR